MKKFKLLKLYLRKEMPVEMFLRCGVKTDVVVYESRDDAKRNRAKARWLWFQKSKPTRRNKRVTLNCYQWQAVWLPDKK